MVSQGLSTRTFDGETVCGDLGLIQAFPGGVLIAAIDGLGHGIEANFAAQRAVDVLREHAQAPLSELMQRCHENLCETRGAALSLASANFLQNMISWTGVGNVEGCLLRQEGGERRRETLLLHNGVVGYEMPHFRVAVLPLVPGDTLIFASDGLRPDFAYNLDLDLSAQQLADFILEKSIKGTDDALVVVTRYERSQGAT
jgi:serine/threonine protein phosphatase PrpC